MNPIFWPRFEDAIASLGTDFETQSVETLYPDFDEQLPKMGPAIIEVPGPDGPKFIALLKGRIALTPDGRRARIVPSAIRSMLCADFEAKGVAETDQLLDRARVPASKQEKARAAILRERFATKRIRGIWLLRLPPSASFWRQLKQAHVPQRLSMLAAAHAIQYALWILAWWVVGSNVLKRHGDQSWLVLWALLLFTLVPLRVLITWLQGLVAIGAGARLKQRLFFGALRLDPDSLRHQGAGQLLGRVLESEAVEALALSGGFLALVALIEMVASMFVLAAGAAGLLHSVLLAAWLIATVFLARQYFSRNRDWTDVRLDMTHDLVENMVGHRTRLAQLAPDQWHQGEDEALEKYLKSSKQMDSSTSALLAIIPRGWLILGLLGLIPTFTHGPVSPARVAIAIGGMLLAYRALRRLATGTWQLAGAAVVWQRVTVLFNAAAKQDAAQPSNPLAEPRPEGAVINSSTLSADNLAFRYTPHASPVLHNVSLKISPADRCILEGPSGSGKSTLVSLLIGLREPTSGQLLINGFDRHTLGPETWRQHIAASPQFHENHVLAETFAFNLLMGHRHALGPDDLPEAEEICRELGLGDLLDRMPAGMLQMVGETGWQLSHGERSRLYIARALLQNAGVIVLDESFAALDPENLKRALECVVKRAPALLVISHR